MTSQHKPAKRTLISSTQILSDLDNLSDIFSSGAVEGPPISFGDFQLTPLYQVRMAWSTCSVPDVWRCRKTAYRRPLLRARALQCVGHRPHLTVYLSHSVYDTTDTMDEQTLIARPSGPTPAPSAASTSVANAGTSISSIHQKSFLVCDMFDTRL